MALLSCPVLQALCTLMSEHDAMHFLLCRGRGRKKAGDAALGWD